MNVIEKTPAVNLAVFRIVFFLTFLAATAWYNPVWFSGVPHEFIRAPSWLGGIVPRIPIHPETMSVVFPLFMAACVSATLGLFTRSSAAAATLLGIYVLGVPQMFGKMNHHHILIWISAVMAFAPSGDMLSIDAVFKAFSRADRGTTDPPPPAKIYGLAVFFILMLMGVAYLFPGLWKLSRGIDWFWSDALKWHLYRKWVELPGWAPFFRLDQYPLLYKPLALGTILFEIGFIGLVLIPRLRPWLAAAGILFHQGTRLFMAIPFWDMQACYAALFNWEKIFHKTGRFLFKAPLFLIYDGHCGICRRAIAAIRVFDVLGRIDYRPSPQGKPPENIQAVRAEKTFEGYDAYRAAAWRIPVLWPALPFLYFFPVAAAGKKIYRHVADTRSCSVLQDRSGPAFAREPSAVPLIALAALLLAVNAVCGIRYVHSWPFSVYPTFHIMLGSSERSVLRIEPLDAEGKTIAVHDWGFIRKLSASRWQVFKDNALEYRSEPQRFEAYLKALWGFMVKENPALARAAKVRFYHATVSGDPDRRRENPIDTELLYELQTGGGA